MTGGGPPERGTTTNKEDLLRDDAACREAFRRGERWAMTKVYRSYLPLVNAVCTHGFGGGFRGFFDPVDREDALQTIFAAAFEERARLSYNGLDPYGSFLRGIAHNVVRRMLESRKRFERKPEELLPHGATLEEAVLQREQIDLVKRFRRSVVDEPDATILTRYFCEGCAEETLAAELGITRYRTRKVIAKLHKRMTRFLKDHGVVSA